MKYKNQSLKKYLDDLSAKLAAPGGGSAAALNAAMAAGLISMVVNFTLGKEKYAAFGKELEDTLAKSERLRKDLLDLVDLDVLAYRSKDTRKAIDVPFMLARLSHQAAKLCLPLIKQGNINLVSDVVTAAVLLESAFVCACFNIEINLKNLQNKELTQKIKKELDQMYRDVLKIRKNSEASYGKIIRG